MAIRSYQRSFNGGEVAPSMYARIDDGKYSTGLAQCRNFLIEPQGPVVNRPGFQYVNETKIGAKKCRLIPFSFSITQTMVLEFGEKYVRFHTQGQTLMTSGGVPYEIETPYAADDLFDIHYVQSADVMTLVHPAYPPKELRRYGTYDWRLVDISFGSTLKAPTGLKVSQHISSSTSNKEDYRRTYAVTALLADGTQESVKSDSVTINCNPYGDGAYNTVSWNAVSGAGLYRVYRDQGGVWCYIGQTDKTEIIDENISPDASITPPIYDDAFKQAKGIKSITVTAGGSGYRVFDGGLELKRYDLVSKNLYAQYRHGGDTFYPQLRVEIIDKSGAGSGATAKIETTTSSDVVWDMAGDSSSVDYYIGMTTLKSITVTSRGSGYVKPVARVTVVKYGSGTLYEQELDFEGSPCSVSITDPTGSGAQVTPVVRDGAIVAINVRSGGQGYTSPKVVITSTTGSGASATASVDSVGDYPGAVSYFEQRRWFGGTYTRPNNLWATRPGTESDMSYSLPSQDDDRIAVRVAAREANRILHIVPLAQLMLLTGAAEWRVSPLNSDAITPSSMSVRPQSYVGASSVQPLVIGASMIYGAGRGGHLRELGYNYEAGGYISGDVCLRAPHLFDNEEILDLAYSKAPWPIVWAVSTSGKLISMTYVPEQQVGAFSTVETDGLIESVCVVAEGEEDILYAVVMRTFDGVNRRYVERMHERRFTELKDCVYLDCSGTYSGVPKTEISGLTWLEGQTVSVLADGSPEGEQKVVDGKIKLSTPASTVHVGLPYEADLKTLPVALQLQDGSFGSGHKKNVREVFFRVVDSSGIHAGPSFDALAEYPARGTELAGQTPDPITDEVGFQIYPAWSSSGQVCVRQAYPLPLRIISMNVVLEIV